MRVEQSVAAWGAEHRRWFLRGCACCVAAGGCALARVCGAGIGDEPARVAGVGKGEKPRIRLVFGHVPAGQPTWPHSEYDYEARKREIVEKLTAGCPGLALDPVTVHNSEQAKEVLAGDRDRGIDGYLVYLVGIWTGAAQVFAGSGKPTLLVDDLYAGSGEFLVAYSAAQRAGQNVAGVSSSRFSDVIVGVRMFEGVKDPAVAGRFAADARRKMRELTKPPGDTAATAADRPPACDVTGALERMKGASILLVGAPMHQPLVEAIPRVFGTKVVPIDFVELEAAYRGVDKVQARAIASELQAGARRVVEPGAEEIERSSAMFLGMQELMKQHGADAVTINCLGGFYGGHMSAYPCLGFCRLNDAGKVGACEADLKSTVTMLLMSYLTGRPGYISDPVIDTSRNQIIYAHCVAPMKVDGPDGPVNPYDIRSHSEDRKGASIGSILPVDRLTTTIEIDPQVKKVIFHQAKTVKNIDEDKACRTKLAAEVKGDIEKLMRYWDHWGWHRVTYYGDLREPVFALAEKMGFEVVEEA